MSAQEFLQLSKKQIVNLHFIKYFNCCGASIAREKQHNQDLRRIYSMAYKLLNSSLFTRMLCIQPECTAPYFTTVYCAKNNMRMSHLSSHRPFCVGFQWESLLWCTCKAMWRRSCLTFTTLAFVPNVVYESLWLLTINCDILNLNFICYFLACRASLVKFLN